MTKADREELIKNLTYSRKNRISIFREIDVASQGYILDQLSPRIRKEIMQKLSNEEIIAFLNFLDPENVTELLRELKEGRSKKITEELNESIKEKVELLLKFSPKAAAGLMNLNYIIVQHSSNFEEVIFELEDYEKRTGKFPTILVIEGGKLIGELPGHTLATRRINERIENHIKKIPAIKYDSEERKVINSFVKNPHSKVVVLNENESVLGVIHSDDILRFINKRAAKDLYDFAGVDKEENALDDAITKVRFRYKWLIINLATAFLAAWTVGLFEDAISQFTLLAVYMPIVAGMGGNAGTQSMAVAVRGIVLKEVELKTGGKLIWNEVVAGGLNGIIIGIIVALIALIFNQSAALGLVIGTAMVVNLIVAGFFGSIIPLIMRSFGKDPASSATIFITTATDVIGFFFFLGLAQIVLLR